MSSPLYRVREFDRHYSVADVRKLKGPWRWVPLPTRHDTKGYRRLIRQPDGMGLYGTWCVILAVSAKCAPPGTLQDQDGPLSADDIADKTGAPPALVARTLQLLSDPVEGIWWLEIVSSTDQTVNTSGDVSGSSGDFGATTGKVSLPDQPGPESPANKQGASWKPKFEYYTWITAEDLSDASKILDWHSRVVKVKSPPLQDTDASRISTLAAASMALAKADDPKAWFVWCVKTDKFKSISQAAEDAASKSLKQLRRRQSDSLGLFGNLVKSTTAVMVPDVDDEPFEDGEGDE